ncbi:uncharacterized protein RHO17_025382 [Thomomys bottae]
MLGNFFFFSHLPCHLVFSRDSRRFPPQGTALKTQRPSRDGSRRHLRRPQVLQEEHGEFQAPRPWRIPLASDLDEIWLYIFTHVTLAKLFCRRLSHRFMNADSQEERMLSGCQSEMSKPCCQLPTKKVLTLCQPSNKKIVV